MRLKRFYPRHPRGWRLVQSPRRCARKSVSIHATLAGGDAEIVFFPRAQSEVSIHATLAGGDRGALAPPDGGRPFLSTPPSRVATHRPGDLQPPGYCFYPRHPRGWRRSTSGRRARRNNVSIHATLAGGDLRASACHPRCSCFYPRHPRGWRLQRRLPV